MTPLHLRLRQRLRLVFPLPSLLSTPHLPCASAAFIAKHAASPSGPQAGWAAAADPASPSTLGLPAEQHGVAPAGGGGPIVWEPIPIRATLVVVPATLLHQWAAEIKLRTPALRFATYTGTAGRAAAASSRPDAVGEEVLGSRRHGGGGGGGGPTAGALGRARQCVV